VPIRCFRLRAYVFSGILVVFLFGSHSLVYTSLGQGAAEDSAQQGETKPSGSPQSDALSSVSSALAASGDRVFALLADNTLLVFGASGSSPVELPLASAPPSEAVFRQHVIAVNSSRDIIFALISSDAQSHQSVVIVDAVRLKVLGTYPLPGDVNFVGLALGARSGRIYLSGNVIRNSQSPRGYPNNASVGDAVVWVLDPGDGTFLHKWYLNLPEEYDWVVYQAEPSEDEQRILVSYHGARTTGIDSFEVAQDELLRCKYRAVPNFGCVYAHGAFAQIGDRLLTATGFPEILEYKSGTLAWVFNTGLRRNNHVMEFAVDSARERIYAIGPCSYDAGLSVLELNLGGQDARMNPDGRTWELLGNSVSKPQILITDRNVCGSRIAVENGSLIVVAQTHGPGSLDTPGALLFVDGGTAQLLSRFTPSSHPVGVAIVHISHP